MTIRTQAWILALAASAFACTAGALAIGCSSETTTDEEEGGILPDASGDASRADGGTTTKPSDGGTKPSGDADAACPRSPTLQSPFFEGGAGGVFCPNKAGSNFCGQAEKCCFYGENAKSECVALGAECPATNDAGVASVSEYQCIAGEQCAAWDAGTTCCLEGADSIAYDQNMCTGNNAATGTTKTTCRAACGATEVPTCASRDSGVACTSGTRCTAFTAATSNSKNLFLGVCR